jgi:PPOX class probable F420-dependent enzyme
MKETPAMAILSEQVRAVIDAPEFATMATIGEDGQPQLSVVWLRTDGHDILVSTTTNRRKYAEVVRDPRVSLLISPREQPYVYITVQGTTTITTDGGPELIQELSQRYNGGPCTFDGPDAVRVVLRISPTKVVYSDPSSRRVSGARSLARELASRGRTG